MKSIDDVLRQQTDQIDLGRGDQLSKIQEVLNKLYPGKVRARKLKDGVLTVNTPSSAVAGDLRLSQEKILKRLEDYEITSLKISIG